MMVELNERELEIVNGGVSSWQFFEDDVFIGQLSDDLVGTTSQLVNHDMPKPKPDEKYIMIITAPPAADIVEELKS